MYCQITSEERYTLGALHAQGFSQAAIARELRRHPSTVSRELKRNSARFDGAYRPSIASERTSGRRSRSRGNRRFSRAELELVELLLKEKFSPEQVTGYLKLLGLLSISHETIYAHIWRDKDAGGELWTQGSRRPRVCRSTSPTRITPGNGEPTRTRMA